METTQQLTSVSWKRVFLGVLIVLIPVFLFVGYVLLQKYPQYNPVRLIYNCDNPIMVCEWFWE